MFSKFASCQVGAGVIAPENKEIAKQVVRMIAEKVKIISGGSCV